MEHEHVWGQWYPYNRTTVYRQCLLCSEIEKKDVSKV